MFFHERNCFTLNLEPSTSILFLKPYQVFNCIGILRPIYLLLMFFVLIELHTGTAVDGKELKFFYISDWLSLGVTL